MVLHNIFFLVLTGAVYLALIPPVEARLGEARRREVNLILDLFQRVGAGTEKQLAGYELVSGTAQQTGVPTEGRQWLESHPDDIYGVETLAEFLYKRGPDGRFWRIRLPYAFYAGIVSGVKLALFSVLGIVYLLAVLALERLIMPRYVYAPIQMLLDADAATLRGDRQDEILEDSLIPGDEIGQIMRSRNATVANLRKREDDLETAKHNLEAQDRLVSLGLLSASVAHEMNTPLAVLHGSIEKMLETAESAPARARLERMVRVTERLRKISEGLLDFARLRQREMAPVALAPLINEAWALVGIDERAASARFVNLLRPEDSVTGNADRLIQVFVNLIRNALNSAGEGGVIRAESRATVIDGRPAVAVSISDNGPGIPPELLPDIFEAFVTTRLDARGTGLGLTVAEGIVHQHGGTITASNCPNGGARLEVTLPAAE